MIAIESIVLILFLPTIISAKPLADKNNATCGYHACPNTSPDKFNVHLVCHSHDDLGWLETVDGYLNDYMVDIFRTVVEELLVNPQRKFVQTETAYLSYWWSQQTEEEKDKYRYLVNNGQIEIVNGAWCSNDEAATHYQAIIDQFTLGHRFLEDEFGSCARTNIGWQVDTFGHSREQASLYSQMGIDGFVFTRFHFEDIQKRKDDKTMDLLWIGSENLGVKESNIFTSIIYNHYSHPSGFCYDIKCSDPEINDDKNDEGYNLEERVEKFSEYIREQATHYSSNNILITMGDDFQYADASKNFRNIDKLIAGFKKLQPTMEDGTPINILYSSPSCYTKAVNDYMIRNKGNLSVKYDDFFPFAHDSHEYWAGFYTSRPTSKKFERVGNNILQIAKQLTGFANLSYNVNLDLEDAIGIMQHHDAITGTEKEAVEKDYHRLIASGIDRAIGNIEESLSKLLGVESLDLTYCPLANSSICPETKKDEFNVLLYNPLGRPITEHVQIPVDGYSWTITDPKGNTVPYFASKPIRQFTEVAEDLDVELNSDIIIFNADLPALGFNVYNVKKVEDSSKIQLKETVKNIKDGLKVGFKDNNVVINDDGLIKQITVQGNTVNTKQEFLYYISDFDLSNPYIFTPDSNTRTAQVLSENVTYTVGNPENGVVEIRQQINDWVVQIIRIYEGEDHIELDWAVGPIDVSASEGREIISRFSTDLDTAGVFYTDSNSRELLKRVYKKRPTYEYTNEEPQSGNYFPITSRALLEDVKEGVQFAIITDRAEGVASLDNGQLEFMIHRVTLGNHPSLAENLNEIEYGIGVIARGTHYITIGKSSSTEDTSVTQFSEVTQRKLAQKVHLRPLTLITAGHVETKTLSLLNKKLPDNVHILTFAKWNDSADSYLIRLEHYFEKNDDPVLSQEVIVDLSDLFTSLRITSFEEKVLSGIKPIEESNRMTWPQISGVENLKKNLQDEDVKVTLSPMQIRTFIVNVIPLSNK